MKQFFTTISIALIVFFAISQYIKNKDIDKVLETQEKQTSQKNPQGGLVENLLTKVLSNILETKEGQANLAKFISSSNSPNGSNIYKMNNAEIIQNIFKIKTTGLDNANKAMCGSTVDVEYEIYDPNNQSTESKRERIQLGNESLDIALSNIIVSMSEGQKRTAQTVEELSQKNNRTMPKNISVTLHKIVSKHFIDSSKIKIFDDILSPYVPYLCSNKIDFRLKISKFDGNVIYKSKDNINYIIGDQSFPVIFAYGLFNKMRTGTRTIISPGSYLRSFTGKPFKGLKFNDNEYYILDIETD